MASREIFVVIVLFIPQGVWGGKSIDLFISGPFVLSVHLKVLCAFLLPVVALCCSLLAGGLVGWLAGWLADGWAGEIGEGE
jgi:hypothetical protein